MAYGDVAAIKQMLVKSGTTWDAADDARLNRLNDAVSLLLEDKIGRAFGTGPKLETVIVEAPGVSDILVLPKPIRSVSAITIAPTWSGTAFTGGEVVLTTAYRLRYVDVDGLAWAVQALNGTYWSGPVLVTGYWADSDDDFLVPADIQYAANYLVAELFKAENAGPAGFSGPDGNVVPVRNPWKAEMVKAVIAKYGAPAAMVAV